MKKIKQPGDNISIKTKKNEAPAVMEWINSQSNLVDSIRYLIENEIRVNGVRNLQHVIPSHRPDPIPGEAAAIDGSQPVGDDRWQAAQEIAAARSQDVTAADQHKAILRHDAPPVPRSHIVPASEIQEQHAVSSTPSNETEVILGDTQHYENEKNLNQQQNDRTAADQSRQFGIGAGHEPVDSNDEEVQPSSAESAAEEKEFVPVNEDDPSAVPEEKPEPEIEDEIDEEDIKSWL